MLRMHDGAWGCHLEVASLAGTLALLVVDRDNAGLAGAQLPKVLCTPADKACSAWIFAPCMCGLQIFQLMRLFELSAFT